MADNDDTAPARAAASNGSTGSHSGSSSTASTSRARTAAASARRHISEASEDISDAVEPEAETLEDQVAQLRNDIRSIANTLTRLGHTGANELKSQAQAQADELTARGKNALDYAQDEFGALEKQIKDTIREKPLTAVASAVALGFILAVITR